MAFHRTLRNCTPSNLRLSLIEARLGCKSKIRNASFLWAKSIAGGHRENENGKTSRDLRTSLNEFWTGPGHAGS
jgi:hypothetical protein